MTSDELIAVIATCHQAGVRSLSMGDLRVKFGPAKTKAPKPTAPMPVQPAPELNPEQADKIKHKVEEMESLMRLDDKGLIERLFPTPKEEPREDE